MKALLLFCYLFSTQVLLAQLTLVELESTYRALNDGRPVNERPNSFYDLRYRGAKGTQYTTDTWRQGIIYLNSGQVRYHELANYDEVEESPVIIGDNGESILISPILVDHFELRNADSVRSFYQFPHPKKKKAEFIFCELLIPGRANVMIYRRKYFVPADNSNVTYNVQLYSEFRSQKSQYFLWDKEQNYLVPIKRGNRSLINQLGEYREELKSYIKENILFARDEEDLVQIMRYYNGLD